MLTGCRRVLFDSGELQKHEQAQVVVICSPEAKNLNLDVGANVIYHGTMKKQPLQVHLDPALLVWLRLEAKHRGISIGEVIRLAVRKLMDTPE